MKKLFAIVVALVMLALTGCEQIFTITEEETETLSYLESLKTFDSDQSGANLQVSTLNLNDDYVLCVDGEALGVIPVSRKVNIKVSLTEDSLKTLWLIPVSDMESEDDLVIDNCQFCWVAKLYVQSEMRTWDPSDSSGNDSSQVTFTPNSLGSQDWDYAMGYINNDDTYSPVAVLTPQDDSGVQASLDFGLISITWKFYQSDPSSNQDSYVLSEVSKTYVIDEDDLTKKIELPMVELTTSPTATLTVYNSEDYILTLYFNGTLIENCMTEPRSGYSYITGYGYRVYDDLLVGESNTLVIMGDSVELARMTVSAEDGENISFTYSEDLGLVELD